MQYTRQQIIQMRGQLKAPTRAAAFRKRYDDSKRKYETAYQKELAKRITQLI